MTARVRRIAVRYAVPLILALIVRALVVPARGRAAAAGGVVEAQAGVGRRAKFIPRTP